MVRFYLISSQIYMPGLSKGDVTFVLTELPHALYKREKSNLVYTTNISIKDALLGPTLKVPLMTGPIYG